MLTFPLYFGLIRDMGPGKAAYNGVVTVVLAMLLSTLLEGYRWTPLAVADVQWWLVAEMDAGEALAPAGAL